MLSKCKDLFVGRYIWEGTNMGYNAERAHPEERIPAVWRTDQGSCVVGRQPENCCWWWRTRKVRYRVVEN